MLFNKEKNMELEKEKLKAKSPESSISPHKSIFPTTHLSKFDQSLVIGTLSASKFNGTIAATQESVNV